MPVVTIWINAFIPETVTGYTVVIPAGTHKDKTGVPLPSAARLNPGNLIKNLDAGYLTDQRTFSDSSSASVRMRSLAEIDIAETYATAMKTVHESSGTTEVDLKTGKQLDFAVADMSRCSFTFTGVVPAPAPAPGASPPPGPPPPQPKPTVTPAKAPVPLPIMVTAVVTGAAGDPLVYTAADIDYVGTFTIVKLPYGGPLTVGFDGKIDAFPAFEAYASFNGSTQAIFTSPPPAGNTVTDLLGPASRAVSGAVVFV